MGIEEDRKLSAAQHRLHLTAFGAVRSGHLAEKGILRNLVLFKSAAGEPPVSPLLMLSSSL
jgi:hypothetical protein